MKLNLKQFALSLILIAALAIGIGFVVKKMRPSNIVSHPPAQSQDVFQKSIEKSINAMLERLYGKKNYFASVVTHLHQTNEETERITLQPLVVSSNSSETYQGGFERLKQALLKEKPTTTELKKEVEKALSSSTFGLPDESPLVIPGRINRKGSTLTQSLPGFPYIASDTQERQSANNPSGFPLPKSETPTDNPMIEAQNAENSDHATNDMKHEISDGTVYYNQLKFRQAVPIEKIDRMFVSVLIDKKRFSQANIAQSELERLLKNISSFDTTRGDQLVISIIPFPNNAFDLEDWYQHYSPQFHKAMVILARLKWIFIGIFGLVLAGLSGWLVSWLLKRAARQRARRLEEAKNREAEQKLHQDKVTATQQEEKRSNIVKMAKEKPSEFAKAIINWIEKSHG